MSTESERYENGEEALRRDLMRALAEVGDGRRITGHFMVVCYEREDGAEDWSSYSAHARAMNLTGAAFEALIGIVRT